MKKFTIKNDVFIKNKKTTFSMMNDLIISLVPLVILSICFNINQAIPFIISLLVGVFIKMFISRRNFFDVREIIIVSSIFGIFIPVNTNIVLILFSDIVVFFCYLLMDNSKIRYKINAIVIGLILIYILNKIFGNNNIILLFDKLDNYKNFNYTNLKSLMIYLFKNGIFFLAFSYIFLIIRKSIKINVVNAYLIVNLLFSIIFTIINNYSIISLITYLLNGSNLFIALYFVANVNTSPLRIKEQLVYGIILGSLITVANYCIGSYLVILLLIALGNLFVPVLNSLNKKNV